MLEGNVYDSEPDESARMVRENFVEPLGQYKIGFTDTSISLFEQILRAEVAEYGEDGLNRLRRASELSIDAIAQYYLDTYRDHIIDVNRLIHLIAAIGLFTYYPWTSTDNR